MLRSTTKQCDVSLCNAIFLQAEVSAAPMSNNRLLLMPVTSCRDVVFPVAFGELTVLYSELLGCRPF